MTTFMTWETSSGKKGRCDARCHNAKGKKCKCQCGGRLHGEAKSLTQAQFSEFLEQWYDTISRAIVDDQTDGDLKTYHIRPSQQKLPM